MEYVGFLADQTQFDSGKSEFVLGKNCFNTRDRGLTRSTSARRRGGDGMEFRLNSASKLKTLKMVPTADMSDARH